MGIATQTLVSPALEWEKAFQEMVEAFDAAREPYYLSTYTLITRKFATHVKRLQDYALGRGLGAGRVPYDTYWLVVAGGRIVGESRLRHRLTPELMHEGGHIGYLIRPTDRRRGYGSCILSLTLEKARERGLHRVLITCDTDNIGSGKIIRKHGGVFDSEVISHHSGKPVSRYWITLD
jgi:predicted acetyltransferase